MKNIFIIGTARGGSTLLHSMLGKSKEILTFPETHLWRKSLPLPPKLRYFYAIDKDKKGAAVTMLQSIHNQCPTKPVEQHLSWPPRPKAWSRVLLGALNSCAQLHQKNGWLEKTPQHLHFAELIRSVHSEAKFIGLVRNPKSHVAALYHASVNHKHSFQQSTVEKALNRYMSDLEMLRELQEKGIAHIAYYEDLVEQPEKTLKEICSYSGIEYSKEMLDFQDTAKQVSTASETWKKRNVGELKLVDLSNERLTKDEIARVEEAVSKIKNPILSRYGY